MDETELEQIAVKENGNSKTNKIESLCKINLSAKEIVTLKILK